MTSSQPSRRKATTMALLSLAMLTCYGLATRLSYLPPPPALAATLCLPQCPDARAIHQAPTEEELGDATASLQSLLPDHFAKDDISILIEKANHRLTVYYQLKPVKSYAVVFGGQPRGDKRFEGDQKTPEGILRVRDLYPHPHWSKFIWLDYPTPSSWRKHWISKLKGRIPWAATVGSEVGIHGVAGTGEAIDNRINWTWGCPSLKNEDVDEIYEVIQVGTVVEIQP